MNGISNSSPTVVTLGCRLNSGEADEMRGLAIGAGVERAVIVNTCAVTGEAVRQGMQQIRRLRRERPDAKLIVTGCAAQIEPERFAAMREVDHVIGNAEKVRSETFAALARGGAPRVLALDIMAERSAGVSSSHGPHAIPRAFVQIQNGCDHRCTFCVIPFGRGRSRSVPQQQVIDHVRRLVEHGMPEVVLTGVDITSWGADLPGTPKLGRLVRALLAAVPGLPRLRISSIDQAEADPDLMAAIAEEPRLMPHLHLSLQSGSDLILKRMKRRHSRADAVAFCEQLRRLRPDIALGADMIAGFPTESETHFRDTMEVVSECGLVFLHVFPYSPRPGTPAARMPQVAAGEVRERAGRLREVGQGLLETWLRSQVGRRISASLERAGAGALPARTPQFAQVRLTGAPDMCRAGETVAARVTGTDGKRLMAEAIA